MLKHKRILIFSAPFGHGHFKAAQAVAAALRMQDPGADVRVVDVFDEYPEVFGKALAKTYLRFVASTPRTYGALYKLQNKCGKYFSGRRAMNCIGAQQLIKTVRRIQPTAIVCTHFLPAGIMDYLAARKIVNVPVYGIVTDFSLHYWWVYRHLRLYFLGCADMLEDFAKFGISSKKALVSGIPVSLKKFDATKPEIMARLGLDPDLPVVALMGGGTGMLPLDDIVRTLADAATGFQIVAVAGTNVAMYKKLLKLKTVTARKLHVHSYIDFVSEIMAVSDLIVSKPGGMTTAETLCYGLPMLVYRPIPGHEADNTSFLLRHKAAAVAGSLQELTSEVDRLLGNVAELEALRNNARALGKPDAALAIAAELLRSN